MLPNARLALGPAVLGWEGPGLLRDAQPSPLGSRSDETKSHSGPCAGCG